MNDNGTDFDIDLSGMPDDALQPKVQSLPAEHSDTDPWTEQITRNVEVVIRDGERGILDVLTLDAVRIDFERPDLGPIEARFGERYHFVTLEAVRAWARKRVERANMSPEERHAEETEWLATWARAREVERVTMLQIIRDPGINSRGLLADVRAAIKCKDEEVRRAVASLAAKGYILVHDGPNRSKLHEPADGQTEHLWRDEDVTGSRGMPAEARA